MLFIRKKIRHVYYTMCPNLRPRDKLKNDAHLLLKHHETEILKKKLVSFLLVSTWQTVVVVKE